MIPQALLRLVVVIVAAMAAAALTPAHAASDWRVAQAAPQWVDQTVYRPNCPKTDCDCDCRVDRFCLPACVR